MLIRRAGINPHIDLVRGDWPILRVGGIAEGRNLDFPPISVREISFRQSGLNRLLGSHLCKQGLPVFVPPPPVTKPDLVVSGIALIGDAKQAYLGSGSTADGAWVKEGEDIMGWQVDGITSVGVTISKAGQSFNLLLYPPMGQE
jgi:hypothetical protein